MNVRRASLRLFALLAALLALPGLARAITNLAPYELTCDAMFYESIS